MKLIPMFVLAALVITGCGSGAFDARRNEAEVMYRVPAYPSRYSDDSKVVNVQPSYRTIPGECETLIDSGNGYYYCDSD